MNNAYLRVTSFRQKMLIAIMGILAVVWVPLTAHAAELETVAKNSEVPVIDLIIGSSLAILAIFFVLGILMRTTNIPWLQNIGTKTILITMVGNFAVLCLSMLCKYLISIMNSAGWNMFFQWPF